MNLQLFLQTNRFIESQTRDKDYFYLTVSIICNNKVVDFQTIALNLVKIDDAIVSARMNLYNNIVSFPNPSWDYIVDQSRRRALDILMLRNGIDDCLPINSSTDITFLQI